ncbi:MFS transporter [Microbacterium sp. cx-59]|uniref:MFS transporter n=1 Tax=Microbacterium sp. cx-59 TaxID=2891207 RepID=UPI001E383E90|nr:MFS transporter [Microbacterium sp. cx-59]MCC4909410.1 MFS transporter [Microbacterium sp. cx-59]
MTPSPRGPRIALLVCAVCLIAANMRATITGVGPLLDQIADDQGTTSAALGALASVPLLTWAIVSPATHALSTRFGMSRVVLWAMIALGAGTAWRSWPGASVNLWLGTVLIGVALAVANVLMPAVVKRDFGTRVPLMMAVYTALLGGVGAVASGVVVPISQAVGGESDGWRIALASTSALLPIAIALWVWVIARSPHSPPARRTGAQPAATTRRGSGIWTDPVAWQVAAYMGLQSSSFYMLVTWLAPFAASHGRSAVAAGFDVMIFQVMGVIGSLAVPLALRGRARRWVPAALPVGGVVAGIGLIVAPDALTLWAACGGLAAGASLNMSLTLMAERARDPATSSALSGMSQSVGYLFAAAGPISFGALHALDPGWTAPLLLLIAVLVAQFAVGVAAGRDRFVLERR